MCLNLAWPSNIGHLMVPVGHSDTLGIQSLPIVQTRQVEVVVVEVVAVGSVRNNIAHQYGDYNKVLVEDLMLVTERELLVEGLKLSQGQKAGFAVVKA